VANPWFRLYSEIINDAKVQMMPEEMRWRLVGIFCLRCEETLETLQERQIAFRLRISPAELAETKAVFIENGFVDEHWNVSNWNARQFISDSSTERVRKHRQALKQVETLHETVETNETVTVTPPDTEQIQNRADSEQKQEQKKPSRSKVASTFVLPEWVNPETWGLYLEVRKKKRAVMTEGALGGIIKRLMYFGDRGYNPMELLENSVRGNWIDIYEPKNGGKSNGANDRNQALRDVTEELISEYRGKDLGLGGNHSGRTIEARDARVEPRSEGSAGELVLRPVG
jgi:hypothetical protein